MTAQPPQTPPQAAPQTAPQTAPKKARKRGLNRLKGLRRILVKAKWLYFTKVWGMDIHETANFSLSASFDRTFPIGVHIGPETYVAFDAKVLTHDMTRGLYLHTRIGARCFIGGRSLILPGIEIGEGSVVGAGSVVTKSVPPGSIVAGNPAKVLREGIEVGPYGRFLDADQTEAQLASSGLT